MGIVFMGKCEEVWVFGDTVSEGMAAEIEKARKLRKKIRYLPMTCGKGGDGRMKIAYGNSRMEKRWKNNEISWDDFCKRVSTTQTTTETVEEYRKMTKPQQDAVKDVAALWADTCGAAGERPGRFCAGLC